MGKMTARDPLYVCKGQILSESIRTFRPNSFGQHVRTNSDNMSERIRTSRPNARFMYYGARIAGSMAFSTMSRVVVCESDGSITIQIPDASCVTGPSTCFRSSQSTSFTVDGCAIHVENDPRASHVVYRVPKSLAPMSVSFSKLSPSDVLSAAVSRLAEDSVKIPRRSSELSLSIKRKKTTESIRTCSPILTPGSDEWEVLWDEKMVTPVRTVPTLRDSKT